MKNCFIISPFGDSDCDAVYEKVYVPLCNSLKLEPIRLDKVNDGSLVMSQIIRNIEDSELIIGDVTLARPNCYFEIGYAMGAKRESRLFLCCREDHNSSSANYDKNSYKLHFDVSGYDVNFWDIDSLPDFSNMLESKIRSRMKQWISTEVQDKSSINDKPDENKFTSIINSLNKGKK